MSNSKLGTNWIDQGKLARRGSTMSGTQSQQPAQRLTLPPDLPHRLLMAARNGLPFLAPNLREKVVDLLTIENCAVIAAFVAADGLFAGTGVGTIINVAVAGMTIAIVGRQGMMGIKHLMHFFRLASNATTSDQFVVAGKAFAQGVTAIGDATLMALLTRGLSAKTAGKVTGFVGRSQAEASWFALAESIQFDIPTDKGVIFAGISDDEACVSIRTSKNPDAQIINDTAEEYGWTKENMELDFGKEYSATTYRLWEALSLKYQAALKGCVTAYIDATKVRLDTGLFGAAEMSATRGAGIQVEISSGKVTPSVILTELEELMTSNPHITYIMLKDIKTGETSYFTSRYKSTVSH